MNKRLLIAIFAMFSFTLVQPAFAGNGGYMTKSAVTEDIVAKEEKCDCANCGEHKHHKMGKEKSCPLPCCAKDNEADEVVVVEPIVTAPLVAEAEVGTKAVAEVTSTTPGAPLKGTINFVQTATGVSVTAEVSGVDVAGKHGFHVHENGDCSDSGKAAGGHFNPMTMQHGFLPNDGNMHAHMGDMGNIDINEEGKGVLALDMPGLTIKGANGIDGKAVILHEKQDDFGQPTGNAGGRVGCGIIKVQ